MRECHPDLSQDEESTEFSTIVNEIYEVRHGLPCCKACCWLVVLTLHAVAADIETP